MMKAQVSRKPGQEHVQDQIQERSTESTARGGANLTQRYRAIGIASVAAAARYVGDTKKPAHAPATSQTDERFVEATV
jgi:hypothetical protein